MNGIVIDIFHDIGDLYKVFFTNKLVFKLFIHLVLVNINGQRGNCTCSYIDDIVIYLKIFKQTLYMFVKIFGDRRIIYTSFQNKVCVLFFTGRVILNTLMLLNL